MTSKIIMKKGKNPSTVDNWLDTLGLYRKNVAYDETCLFRAVSEQLFDSQVYHERVRKECIAYARKNYHEFSELCPQEKFWEHLNLLEKHMVICGKLEINLISKKYQRDVVIFDATHQQVDEITKSESSNSPLLLCLMDEDHFDVVYNRDHIVTTGFCQSIIYKILYEDVFHIKNVEEIVNAMLYEKSNVITATELIIEQRKMMSEVNNNESNIAESEEHESTSSSTNIAPFPFKVAKALDPTIYRNIEYDSWGEVRRELRLGEWYYGDDKLILGTRCILNDREKNSTDDCYIQEIIKDQNKCIVFLTKTAERRTVDYSDLSPESDAKPWPLPYRFSKNLVIGSPSSIAQIPPIEKNKSTRKRNKENKRRIKSCSESSALSNAAATSSEAVENLNNYVGIPLQMQNTNEISYKTESVTREIVESACQTEVLLTPMTPMAPMTPMSPMTHMTPMTPEASSSSRYQWEQPPQWPQYLPPTPDSSYLWSQTPTTPQHSHSANPFNFNLKPMVASAPVTPDVVPYHDPNFPFYYNYHVEPYPTYGTQWIPQQNPDYHLHNSQGDKQSKDCSKQNTHIDQQNHPYTEQARERPTLTFTPHTPQPMEQAYSPMIPVAPGTPIIYAQEMTEMVMPTTPIAMYTPPVDMQYMSPGPYLYPPTPPAAWYPPSVNSQGFIFPPPVNQTMQK